MHDAIPPHPRHIPYALYVVTHKSLGDFTKPGREHVNEATRTPLPTPIPQRRNNNNTNIPHSLRQGNQSDDGDLRTALEQGSHPSFPFSYGIRSVLHRHLIKCILYSSIICQAQIFLFEVTYRIPALGRGIRMKQQAVCTRKKPHATGTGSAHFNTFLHPYAHTGITTPDAQPIPTWTRLTDDWVQLAIRAI